MRYSITTSAYSLETKPTIKSQSRLLKRWDTERERMKERVRGKATEKGDNKTKLSSSRQHLSSNHCRCWRRSDTRKRETHRTTNRGRQRRGQKRNKNKKRMRMRMMRLMRMIRRMRRMSDDLLVLMRGNKSFPIFHVFLFIFCSVLFSFFVSSDQEMQCGHQVW